MRDWIYHLLFEHWQRKVVASITAVIVWGLVSHSITASRTFTNVPVRIIQVPQDKTVKGLLPDGYLSRRVTLTLRGSKASLEALDPDDVEVLIDASGKGDEWVADIGKKNLISLNSEVDLQHSVISVNHSEFIVKLRPLVTEKVRVSILPPYGEPPQGYQFLDVWPPRLYHTVSGPRDQVEELRMKGLELAFDLSSISGEELDALDASRESDHEDEVRFPVPDAWKKVSIPFLDGALQPINDPDAKNLHIEFLRKEVLPLEVRLPISVFYPPQSASRLNPDTAQLDLSFPIDVQGGLPRLNLPLLAGNVSRLFLDVVQDHLMLTIIASDNPNWDWHVQFVNPKALEDHYVERLLQQNGNGELRSRSREDFLRQRFREYMRNLELYLSNDTELELHVQREGKRIRVTTFNFD